MITSKWFTLKLLPFSSLSEAPPFAYVFRIVRISTTLKEKKRVTMEKLSFNFFTSEVSVKSFKNMIVKLGKRLISFEKVFISEKLNTHLQSEVRG